MVMLGGIHQCYVELVKSESVPTAIVRDATSRLSDLESTPSRILKAANNKDIFGTVLKPQSFDSL